MAGRLAGRLAGHVRELVGRVWRHDAFGLAAELAYRFLFALFPFVIFLAALSGFIARGLGIDDPSARIVSTVGFDLPSNLADPIRDQLKGILDHAQPGLLSLGGLLALWAAVGGMNAVVKSLNRAFDVPETRSVVSRFVLAGLLTVVGGLSILVSFVAVVGGALMTRHLIDQAGLGTVWPLLALLRWPFAFLLLALAVSVLFRYAPAKRPAWSAALIGAVVFAVVWLAGTWVFGLYVSRFATFDVTYGALAGVIGLLLWFYLTAFLLVCAGELAAHVQRHTQSAATVEAPAAAAAAGRS